MNFWRSLVFSMKPNFGLIISVLIAGLLPKSVIPLTVRGISLRRNLWHKRDRCASIDGSVAPCYDMRQLLHRVSAQLENAPDSGTCNCLASSLHHKSNERARSGDLSGAIRAYNRLFVFDLCGFWAVLFLSLCGFQVCSF